MTNDPNPPAPAGPAGPAGSGGTRTRAGSNYGDWAPTRVTGLPAQTPATAADHRNDPVGTEGQAQRAPPGGADGAAGPLPAPLPLDRSVTRWWQRLKPLFQRPPDRRDPHLSRDDDAAPQPRSSTSGDTS